MIGTEVDFTIHFKRILKRYQVVVHLVRSVAIANYLSEEDGEELSLPTEESASDLVADHNLPATNDLKLPIPVSDLSCRAKSRLLAD